MNEDSQQTESSNPIVEGASAPMTSEEVAQSEPITTPEGLAEHAALLAPEQEVAQILAETAPPEPPAVKSAYRFKRMLVAMVAHEVNKAYCEALGDTSQPSWADAPDWQVQSAIAGVAFHRGHPEAGPSASHESWMEQKIRDGWNYGSTKDTVAKTHPCLVPFDQLPKEQQAKDHLFRAVVHALSETLPVE